TDEAVGYGLTRMSLVCMPYFRCGLMDVAVGALRGIGASLIPMLTSVFGCCAFRLIWIGTVFRADRTLENVYVSYLISWILTLVLHLLCFVFFFRRVRKRLLGGGKPGAA
ncbi:MAG: MATE family efflux transporter, partial [Lachnospiraceae bacterium]|nr:MATE family efflux transporter [Lachnospiraceae bacterium]